MKGRVFATLGIVLLCSAITALPARAADGGWTSWWRNADQRGEKLLQEGDAAAAARVFADPRRKAYAKIVAGDYQQAAQDLSAFDDGDAHYNRGNALAHAGKLQEALQAYDLALHGDPNNQDARHNRELVANALRQKAPEKTSAGAGEKHPRDDKQSRDGKDRDEQGSGQSTRGDSPPRSGQQGRPEAQAGKSATDEGEGAQQRSAQDAHQPGSEQPSAKGSGEPSASSPAKNIPPSGAGKANEHAGRDQPAPDSNAPGSDQAQQGQAQPGAPANSRRSPASAQQQAKQAGDAEQARRDAAASLTPPPVGQTGEAGGGKLFAGRGEAPATALPSERQLAQEQWLRSIPDDPGGLLRRKFLVEHLLRQQKSQP